jgi:alkylation response protein AidB-like acyl-CoA dehydrogenase
MNFELSEDQRLLRDSVREFLGAELPFDTSRRIMEHEPRGFDATAWLRFAEMGFLGVQLPEAAGGQGLGMIDAVIVLEEIGRACAPGPHLDVMLAAALLAAAGGHERELREIAAGKRIVTIAREDSPWAGTAEPAVRTTNGRIQGSKYFVPFAAAAEALLVVMPEGLFRIDAPFDVSPMPTLDVSQRFVRVQLDHVGTRIAEPALVARLDPLVATAAAAVLLGLMTRSFETTLEYVKTRQAFGRPIGSFQVLQHRLADMLLRVESTRSAVYRSAWCLDQSDSAAAIAAASAKAYAGDAARKVCGESIQMHGGIGFTWEVDLHFFFKRAKTIESFYGSTEAQLERVLAAAGF